MLNDDPGRDDRERGTAAAAMSGPVAVLDMGASAVRLAIAEVRPGGRPRVVEELSRGVLLGRDTFSAGTIRSQTIDAVITALEGFRKSMDAWGVTSVRAAATSFLACRARGVSALISFRTRTFVPSKRRCLRTRSANSALRRSRWRNPAPPALPPRGPVRRSDSRVR